MSGRTDSGLCWYSLFCVKGLGPKRLHAIYKALKEADIGVDEIVDMDAARLQNLLPHFSESLQEAILQIDRSLVQQEYEQLLEADIEAIHLGHEEYPAIVTQRMQDSAPPLLFCHGPAQLLAKDSIAVVGSRSASEKGLELASRFGTELALAEKNVISGYAKGIDSQAHWGALRKEGTTTIVLSSGILDFSPKKDWEDVNWSADVLVVSQFHPRQKWNAGNAMIRNKLVCALSQAVIVIEAGAERDDDGKMSGTFDAGKTALDMRVPLFVVSPRAFENPPAGNEILFQRGGIEIGEDGGISSVIKYLEEVPVPAAQQGGESGQLF